MKHTKYALMRVTFCYYYCCLTAARFAGILRWSDVAIVVWLVVASRVRTAYSRTDYFTCIFSYSFSYCFVLCNL